MEDKHTVTPPNNGAESSPTNQSPESSRPRIQRERSPNSICAVCLGTRQNPCFSDGCLHEFCFECLRQWSQEKPECPLCKTRFRSIIHNIRSEDDYDVYELPAPENMWLNIVYIDFLVSGQWYRHSAMFRTNNSVERMQLYFLEGRIESPEDTPADILPQPSNPEHRVESNDSTSTQMPTSDSSIRNTSTASQRSNSFVSSPSMTINSAYQEFVRECLRALFPRVLAMSSGSQQSPTSSDSHSATSVPSVSPQHPASSNPAEAEPMQRDENFGSDDLAIMAYAELSRDATLQVFSLVSSDEEDDENALFYQDYYSHK
ncbi:uncharacterized protein LOC110827411 isoform X2 [Zootermopsis nevadensis]|uniref:uncharacterized protein LOC110827411 isoform X2 n=1 Tax=Zootermopsis nevadensis TaxID=136037 RepID=UPI000B8EAC29|nr:uncharacterized protein LOC110827411 isoform X2 [Zootermopsis nevadensis]